MDDADLQLRDYSVLRPGLYEERIRARGFNLPFSFRGRPRAFDWDEQGAIGPVRDQGKCKNCTSFAVAAMLEAQYAIDEKKKVDLAAEWIHACLAKKACGDEVYLSTVCKLFASPGQRLPRATEAPADAEPNCTITGSFEAPAIKKLDKGEEALKQHIAHKGPVVVSLFVGKDFFPLIGEDDFYQRRDDYSDNHAICVTGYNDDKGWWRAKNSMGSAWSKSGGWVRIAYKSCEIGIYPSYGVA